jgi:two-component system KDP operon response regulator KdpE
MDTQSADTPIRILVVDDEPNIRESLVLALNLMGYRAEEAQSGREALKMLEGTPFDLMVLDMHMPEMDGIEVMQRARRICSDLPIIVLTGHATLDSAIAAVKSGAADYLLKPASIHDIAAAVGAALRSRTEQLRRQHWLRVMDEAMDALRQTETPPPSPSPAEMPVERFLRAGPLALDRQKRLVVISSAPPRTAKLTEGETLVLTSLMNHLEQVLTCRQLARAAWEYDLDEFAAQSLIRPYIFSLRRKIEPDPRNPQLLLTVRGRGYCLQINSSAHKLQ